MSTTVETVDPAEHRPLPWRARPAPVGLGPRLAEVAGGAVAAGLLIVLIAWTDSFQALVPALTRGTAPVGLFVGMAVALLVAGLLVGGIAYGDAYLATLWATMPFLPSVAAVGIVVTYLALPDGEPLHHESVLFGLIVAAGVWIVSAGPLHGLASADIAQSRSFEELRDRTQALADRAVGGMSAVATSPDAEGDVDDQARRALRGQLALLGTELGFADRPGAGLRYVLASGYINLWRTLHRAEELQLEIEELEQVVADAAYDDLRLAGSNMSNAPMLRVVLRAAVKTIDPNAAVAYLPRLAPAPSPPEVDIRTTSAASTDTNDKTAARHVIGQVRRSINEYRDSRWDGLVRERNRLLRTVLLTATAVLLLVGLAVAMDVGKPALAAGSTYFLVAATVGLFARLRVEGTTDSAVDDYGLFEARLLQTPLVSGLAGLAGVFLVAALPTVTGGPSDGATPTLDHVFDLSQNARALLAAAAFALSPELLVGSLRKQVEGMKGDLTASQAAGTSSTTEGAGPTGTKTQM